MILRLANTWHALCHRDPQTRMPTPVLMPRRTHECLNYQQLGYLLNMHLKGPHHGLVTGETVAISTLRTSSSPTFFPACSASLYVRISCAAQPSADALAACARCAPRAHTLHCVATDGLASLTRPGLEKVWACAGLGKMCADFATETSNLRLSFTDLIINSRQVLEMLARRCRDFGSRSHHDGDVRAGRCRS